MPYNFIYKSSETTEGSNKKSNCQEKSVKISNYLLTNMKMTSKSNRNLSPTLWDKINSISYQLPISTQNFITSTTIYTSIASTITKEKTISNCFRCNMLSPISTDAKENSLYWKKCIWRETALNLGALKSLCILV